ncbi:MAG: hypothetical protein J6D44_14590, partial [Pseudomonas sp.]|nr:hypothetical protein [Pseudomonas sp.]
MHTSDIVVIPYDSGSLTRLLVGLCTEYGRLYRPCSQLVRLHPLEAVIPEKKLRTANNKKKVCQVVSIEPEDCFFAGAPWCPPIAGKPAPTG